MSSRNFLLFIIFSLLSSFGCSASAQTREIYRAAETSAILDAARAIIAQDPDCALITIDGSGQPRVRTVTASPPEDDMTIWIATRPATRKVKQIEQHAKVSLYFNDDAQGSYVSVMGTAKLHNDLATKEAKDFYARSVRDAFWPNYPDDYLLIEVTPQWIEVIGHGIAAHPQTWRPQGIVLGD